MAGVVRRASVLASTIAALVFLSACAIAVPFGESSNGMTSSLDTAEIADAITATSSTIESTIVETSLDGLTTRLYVVPTITSQGFSAAELDAVLRVAYESSAGEVESIEVRTVDPANKPVNVKIAAAELGIQHLDNINSVTYSTTYLKKAYDK